MAFVEPLSLRRREGDAARVTLPLNRLGSATMAQHACNGRHVERMQQANTEDEPMKPQGYLITWVMAMLPALAALWTTSA